MTLIPYHKTSCPDWDVRLLNKQKIIPLPVYESEADKALQIFKSLRVTDLPGKPTFGECSDDWVFDFVRAIFGAYNSETGQQHIREFFLLLGKKNT
jgi:phage terminase large subunit-like protein